jgi:hypothetical protein
MECVECERARDPGEWGWVVVLTRPDEPRMIYCPTCFSQLLGPAPGNDEPAA